MQFCKGLFSKSYENPWKTPTMMSHISNLGSSASFAVRGR